MIYLSDTDYSLREHLTLIIVCLIVLLLMLGLASTARVALEAVGFYR